MAHMPPFVAPNVTPLQNASGAAVVRGQVVYLSSSGQFSLASSLSLAAATVLGVVADATIAPGATGSIQTAGFFATSGLTALAAYFVTATPGAMSATPPSVAGQYIGQIGTTPNQNALEIAPQAPIQVGATPLNSGLVMIWGHSEAKGRGDATTVGGSWLLPYPDVQMFQQFSSVGPPSNPIWQNANGPLAPYAGGSIMMGCELSLGRTLVANGCPKIIGKFAQDETDLANHWNPTGTYPAAAPNNLFDQAVAYTQGIIASTGAPLKAIVLFSGSNDANDNTQTANYGANLAAFIAATRAAFSLPSLPFLIIQLGSDTSPPLPSGNVATIQAAQSAYVAIDPNSVLINTADLTSETGGNHYNATDQITLGNRVAIAALPLIGGRAPTFTIDSFSLAGLPATNAECTAFLSDIVGAPVNPSVIYNFQNALTDANGGQAFAAGSGFGFVVPSAMSRFALFSADGNTNACSNTAGPMGTPYAESELILALIALTGVPSAEHDVFGIGGGVAYRGLTVAPSAGFAYFKILDLSGGNSPIGTVIAGTLMHKVWLQLDRTNHIFRAVTDREVITQNPYVAPTVTTPLFAIGRAGTAATGPIQIPIMYGWRGAGAEMSLATMQAINTKIDSRLAA